MSAFTLLFAVTVLAIWFLRIQILAFLGNALVENDGPQKAQAIVVLGGDRPGVRITRRRSLLKPAMRLL